jgi:hypothetical protein
VYGRVDFGAGGFEIARSRQPAQYNLNLLNLLADFPQGRPLPAR